MKEHFGDMESPSEKIILPTISLDSNQVKEIKDWDPPEKYRLVIDIKQTSKNVGKDGKVRADFDITAYKYIPKKGVLEMDDEEFEEEEGKQLEKMSKR